MSADCCHLRRKVGVAVAALATILGTAISACAQSTQPAQFNLDSLQQLSAQTQQIYQRVRADVVRVKLPAALWFSQQHRELQQYLERYGASLRPEARQQLISREEQLSVASTRPIPTSGPDSQNHTATAPIATALLIDDQGHAMLPLFIDPQMLGGARLPVMIAGGRMGRAKLVGSDEKTNLSVLQLEPMPDQTLPLPPAARLASVRPDDGQLVLLLNVDGGGRLLLWDDARFDPGLAVMTDGSVAGFCFNNQFLAATACRPIVQQLIASGAVHRAALGVWVEDVHRDDPLRQQVSALGSRRAIYVDKVVPDSLAEHAGLRHGDVIISAGGQAVEDCATFAAIIATRSGATDLGILRGNVTMAVSVDLRPQ